MEIYNIIKKVQAENRKIYVRGVTFLGHLLGIWLDEKHIPFEYVDNNPEKQGKVIFGQHICRCPDELDKNSFVFITVYTDTTARIIANELRKQGIPYVDVFQKDILKYMEQVDDEVFVKALFQVKLGYPLDLENPETICEKIQWLKLYYHDPLYTILADKYEAKKYVASLIGKEHIIPTLGVWDRFDDINFENLPNQFMLKCTHDSGSFIHVKNKTTLDKISAKKFLEGRLMQNYFYKTREWAYKNVKPRIIAEVYMDGLGKRDSLEYKVSCFGGKVGFVTSCRGIPHDTFDVRTNDHFTPEFKRLNWWTKYKNSSIDWKKPTQWDLLLEMSETLSAGIPYVRVDFYILNGRIYFGEMTFYTWAGFMNFHPPEWDKRLGDMIQLPDKLL